MTSKIKKVKAPYFLDKTVNGTENITINGNSISMHYGCPNTTDCSPYVLELPRGQFLVEVWGARGCEGSAGGYSRGILTLNNKAPDISTFYVYVGSSGIKYNGNGGFNGGGAIGSKLWVNGYYEYRYVGGGATDIRTIKGQLVRIKSIDFYTSYFGPNESLKSRIIVAGGGGGWGSTYGYGGGREGPVLSYGSAGSQVSGGITEYSSYGQNGGFGYGGFTRRSDLGISGGGGGYYGGGGSTYAFGGSGFVNTSVLKEAKTINGNEEFPSPYSPSKETGHLSDGCARITFLDSKLFYTKQFDATEKTPIIILIIITSS